MLRNGESALSRVSQQLSHLEKRDWELWGIVSLTAILVSTTLLAILFHAAFFANESIHFELTVSRPLVIGLFVLLALLNTYLVKKRFEVRRLREQLISSTLQAHVIEQQSFIDPLTEIYNRRALDETAGRFISHAKRTDKVLTCLMVDVDNFKGVNTRFGHLMGDFVLSEIAAILKASIRGCDAAIRYGGDEFLIILVDSTACGAHIVVNRINERLADWNDAGHLNDFQVSVSMGIAEWHDGTTLEEMLEGADHEMYARKNSRGSF